MKEDVKEKTPPRPSEDVGVVTYIQPHHILREVSKALHVLYFSTASPAQSYAPSDNPKKL